MWDLLGKGVSYYLVFSIGASLGFIIAVWFTFRIRTSREKQYGKVANHVGELLLRLRYSDVVNGSSRTKTQQAFLNQLDKDIGLAITRPYTEDSEVVDDETFEHRCGLVVEESST